MKVSANLLFANLASGVNFLLFHFCITFSKKHSSRLSVKWHLHHPLRKQIDFHSGLRQPPKGQPNNSFFPCIFQCINYFTVYYWLFVISSYFFLLYWLFLISPPLAKKKRNKTKKWRTKRAAKSISKISPSFTEFPCREWCFWFGSFFGQLILNLQSEPPLKLFLLCWMFPRVINRNIKPIKP